MIVYLVRNKVNGKGYVGQTRRTLEGRWSEHVHNALKMMCEMPIYDAIRKHGVESFEVTVLQECSSEEELNQSEKDWIEKLGTFSKGYNATRGGYGISGYKHTEDAKFRMGLNRSGSKNHNYGKAWGKLTWTQEDIEVVRQKNKSNPRCHLPRTDEDKKKIDLAASIHKRKAVKQYTKDGKLIMTYKSIQEAAKAIGGQANKISDVLCGRRMTHKGYIWQYEKQPERVEV